MNLADKCNIPNGYCLRNQLVDLYYADVERINAGHDPLYFVTKYSGGVQNERQVRRSRWSLGCVIQVHAYHMVCAFALSSRGKGGTVPVRETTSPHRHADDIQPELLWEDDICTEPARALPDPEPGHAGCIC